MKPPNGDHLAFGPFRFDPVSGLLFEEGVEVALPPRASALLTSLLEAPGEMVSKEELIEAVWGDTAVSDQSLTEAVKLLRHALHDDPKNPVYIHTLRRRGYRFIADVSAVPRDGLIPMGGPGLGDEAVPTGEVGPSAIRPGPVSSARERRSGRRLLVGVAALAILAIGGTFLVWTGLNQTTDQLARLERRVNVAGTGPLDRVVWQNNAEFSGSPSPDGKYVAYVGSSQQPQLWLYETVTRERLQLTNREPGHAVHRAGRAVFSPDGRSIAYVVWHTNEGVAELRVVSLDELGQPREDFAIRSGESMIVAHDWTADGDSVLAARQGEAGVEIVLIPVSVPASSRREPQQLKVLEGVEDPAADGPRKISLSPGGSTIAYDVAQGDGTGNRDIHTVSLVDDTETTIVEHPLNDHSPLWAPDGERLVFVSNREDLYGVYTVRIADHQEAGPTQLNTPGRGWSVRLLGLTTGGSLYYGTGFGAAGTDVYIAPLQPGTFKSAGQPVRVLPETPGQNISPTWSPDGKYLAFVAQRGPFFRHEAVLVINDVEGSQGIKRHELPTALGFIRQLHWSPDGRSILAWGRTPWGIHRIDAESGEVERLVRGQRTRWPHWSANDSTIFYYFNRPTTQSADNGDDPQAEEYQIRRWQLSTSDEPEDRLIHPVIAPEGIASLRLSPDGQQLGFLTTNAHDTQSWSIRAMPLFGEEPTAAEVFSGSDPTWDVEDWRWTPDGKAILYVRRKSPILKEDREIWKFDLVSGRDEAIDIAMPGIQTIAIDPAGLRIAFVASTQEPSSDLHVLSNFLGETGPERQ